MSIALGTAVDPFFERQTTDDWRAKGGLNYRMVPDIIGRMPKGLQNAATKFYQCTQRFLAGCGLDPLQSTNPAMADDMGMSMSFAKKGFKALREPYELVRDPEAEDGWRKVPLPPILVSERKHGRRKIKPGPESKLYVKRDRSSDRDPIESPPLCTPPPGERQRQETTTTTKEVSSSSLASRPGTGPELPSGLAEAVGLLPGLSAGEIRAWMTDGGPELARLVVRYIRASLLDRDPEKRPKTAGFASVLFLRWNARLKDGVKSLADIEQEVEVREKKWARRDPAATAKAEAEKRAKAAADAEVAAKKEARQRRFEAAWGSLPESERAAIEAEVLAEYPHLVRFKPLLKAACVVKLGTRLEPADPPQRE